MKFLAQVNNMNYTAETALMDPEVHLIKYTRETLLEMRTEATSKYILVLEICGLGNDTQNKIGYEDLGYSVDDYHQYYFDIRYEDTFSKICALSFFRKIRSYDISTECIFDATTNTKKLICPNIREIFKAASVKFIGPVSEDSYSTIMMKDNQCGFYVKMILSIPPEQLSEQKSYTLAELFKYLVHDEHLKYFGQVFSISF